MPIYLSQLNKPKFGTPCNGCGYCCGVEPCEIAQNFLGAGLAGACPALEVKPETGTLVCGMMIRPLHYLLNDEMRAKAAREPEWAAELEQHNAEMGQTVAQTIAAGKGCDSEDDEHSQAWPWPIMLKD